VAESAVVKHCFLGDANSDICTRDCTRRADVADGRRELHPAVRTEYGRSELRCSRFLQYHRGVVVANY